MADYDAGRYQEAARGFEQYLGSTPRPEMEAEAGLGLARALEGERKPLDALRAYEKVLERHPGYRKDPRVAYETAALKIRLGQLDEAERILKRIEKDARVGKDARALLKTVYARRLAREKADDKAAREKAGERSKARASRPAEKKGRPAKAAEPAKAAPQPAKPAAEESDR